MKFMNMGGGTGLGTGLVIGATAVVLGPMLITLAGGVLKSLTKAGIKGGLIAYEEGRAAVNSARGSLHHLTEEARSEIKK